MELARWNGGGLANPAGLGSWAPVTGAGDPAVPGVADGLGAVAIDIMGLAEASGAAPLFAADATGKVQDGTPA